MKLFKMMAILALCLLTFTTAPGLSQTHVKIDPASTSVDVGEIFTVDVLVEDALNMRGVSVKVGFDPTVLNVQGVTSGGFMSSFGQTFSFSEKNNDEGWVQYDESILGSGDMAEGGGTVCHLEFEAIAAGSSALTFLVADLRDNDNMSIETTTEDGLVMVGGSAVVVQLYAALEGAFDAAHGVMRTDLRERDVLPLDSPYDSAPESVTAIPENVVDWVLVQLRQSAAGATVAEKSCFIKNDGSVIQADGQTTLTFWGVDAGSYHIVLSHRNHLSAMSADAVALNDQATEFDFSASASNVYGGEAKMLNQNPPVYGLFAGDGDDDGEISQTDIDGVLNNRDLLDYSSFDFNMSGIVTISDVDYANGNSGTQTNVPAN